MNPLLEGDSQPGLEMLQRWRMCEPPAQPLSRQSLKGNASVASRQTFLRPFPVSQTSGLQSIRSSA